MYSEYLSWYQKHSYVALRVGIYIYSVTLLQIMKLYVEAKQIAIHDS